MKKELVKLHHARSQKDFPQLNLEEDEYVELAIKRAQVGLFMIWGAVFLGFILLTIALILLSNGGDSSPLVTLDRAAKSYLYIIVIVLYGVIFLTGLISTAVYKGNELFVTNKRLIHKCTTSLFSKSTNIIDLVSIEDVSFMQSGLLDHILKLGTLRMSTVGDETTYTFKYIDTPKNQLDTITHLVHVEKERTKENK